MYRKEICYDRETHDYAMYIDGELVGFARTYHEAEIWLDQLVFELMSGQFFAGDQPARAAVAAAEEATRPKPGPFASLRDMVYTECPCGCGAKEVCDEQRARVQAHNDAIPF